MNHRMSSVSLALTFMSFLGLAHFHLAVAQQPAKDMVPFKAAVAGRLNANDPFIPTDPPVVAGLATYQGTSDALGGAVTYTDTHLIHLGVDGSPTRATNGIAVFAGPSGDALFVTWDGVPRPTATQGVFQTFGGFTITGGRGKFAGVTGSGRFSGVLDLVKGEDSEVWEGLIAVPKK